MPDMKGVTVRIPAELHAEVKAYLEAHGMTMGEFITQAVDNELHPKIQMTQEEPMERMRTLAFQVPDSLFQRVKAYLERNHMTQKQFVIGLIESELEQDEAQYVKDVLKLTRTEVRSITQFERGEALIHSNNNKVPVVIKASVEEKEMITTDRAELEAILRKRQKEAT